MNPTLWKPDDEEMMNKIFQRYHEGDITNLSMAQVSHDIGWLQGAIMRLKEEINRNSFPEND